VEVLNVENVIVCGHTQCGALKAILDPDSVAHLEFVKRWLKGTMDVKKVIDEKYAHLDGEAKLTAAFKRTCFHSSSTCVNTRSSPVGSTQASST